MKAFSVARLIVFVLTLLAVRPATAQMLERELAEPRVPAEAAATIPTLEQRRDALVRTLTSTLQLQPHQALLVRQALTEDLNLAPFPSPTSELVQIPFQEQLRLLLMATQLNRLREWEQTAPEARQLSFIALEL